MEIVRTELMKLVDGPRRPCEVLDLYYSIVFEGVLHNNYVVSDSVRKVMASLERKHFENGESENSKVG